MRDWLQRPITLVIAGVVVVAVIIAAVAVAVTGGGGSSKHLTAYFTKTIGIYQGNDVRVLGVKVGTIDSITPAGPQVKVEMSYDSDVKLPQDVKAVVITPSIVSDRYVQLTPAYTGGPTLADNQVLSTSRTAVPLELDQIFGSLNNLDKALGPNGANKHGALSRLLKIGAKNLKGNGGRFNHALRAFSDAVTTLSGSRGNLFSTVSHLAKFTTMLAKNDGGVRKLNANLATVGAELSNERHDLGAALSNLSLALSAVNGFVKDNKDRLSGDIHGLAKVTNVLSQEKEAITEFTDIAPLALSDLSLAYDPKAHTLDTKADLSVPIFARGPAGALCQLLGTLGLENLLGAVNGCTSSKSGSSTTPDTSGLIPHTLRDLLAVRP